ncbi:hypothetical protein EB796_014822 [Bugula neritina]|uniref:Uncharacterized protein n=1 Tax=Bugula neritina TaxID=10212 RepID=A0A7J7JKM6_BUGNE|nr:hypothetical protein EB796_014822 [Bugula neritina]
MKGWCITATVLLLQLFIENIDTSEHDSPPVFTQLNTLKYIDPVIVNASDNGNVLQCTAVNADRVTWRYKKTVSTQDYDSLPQGLVQTNAFRNPTNGYLTRTLATDSTRSSTKLSFTGYYFCVASNNYGYFDESPPLHLITPGKYKATVLL